MQTGKFNIINKLKEKMFDKKLLLFLMLVIAVVCLALFCIKGYYINKGHLSISRAYHETIFLDKNRLLITGGVNGLQRNGIKCAEIYFINENKSEITAHTNIAHIYHKLFKMSDGNIVIADINGIEIYDVKLNKFKLLKTRPNKRYPEFKNYKFALGDDDLLFIAGGREENTLENINSFEIIDLKEDKLIKKGKFQGNGFGIAKLKDGNFIIAGGKSLIGNKEILSNEIYIFDTKKMTFRKFGSLPEPIFDPFIFSENDNKAVIIGGEILDGYSNYFNKKYAYTRGSTKLITIQLNNQSIETKDIKHILKKAYNCFILNAQKISDNLYWIQLGAYIPKNTIIFDMKNNKETKGIFKAFNTYSLGAYKSNVIPFENGLIITGGKMLWEEPAELVIGAQFPGAKEQYKISTNRNIVNQVITLNVGRNNK